MIVALLRRLFSRKPSPIAALARRRGARVVVRGRVVPRDLIDSPHSGERCVYYHYLLEELRGPAVTFPGAGPVWTVIGGDEAICEFYVEDDSGRALIVPERAVVDSGPMTRHAAERDDQRVLMSQILPGDVIEVRGVADEIADLLDDRRGYRESAQRSLVRAPANGAIRIRRLAT